MSASGAAAAILARMSPKNGTTTMKRPAQLHPTKNPLPQESRAQLVELLNSRLATAIDLQLQAKHAHWNVKGPNFIALHELFDKVVESAEEWVDLTAERIVQLGGQAEGTVQATAARTSLPQYPLSIVSGKDHVEALSNALAAYGKKVRSAIDKCDKLGDKDAADIFTEISRDVDKYLWFVEAHNQRGE